MSEPYGVLNAGEWSLWCRACTWRSVPRRADPLTFRASLCSADADWRAHLCIAGSGGTGRPAVGSRAGAPSNREVA
jgi:hypothetical protein